MGQGCKTKQFKGVRKGTGLALSGGGFRATLFHLGVLWRLNELGILRKVSRVSSVSGGSILNGLLATKWRKLDFQDGIATNFVQEIVPPTWTICSQNLDIRAALVGVFFGARGLTKKYKDELVGNITLQDIPDEPDFLFNAAHVETGRGWYFSKSKMETYRLGFVPNPCISLAEAITASSVCPPFFPPVVIKFDPDTFYSTELSKTYDKEEYDKGKVYLTDGGVYDNLGMQKIMPYEVQLYSDASGPLATRGSWWGRGVKNRIANPVGILSEQTRSLRRREIVSDFKKGVARGALWTISTEIDSYCLTDTPYSFPKRYEVDMSRIRTRLNKFNDKEKAMLINWGYAQCDCSIRTNYLKDVQVPAGTLPYG